MDIKKPVIVTALYDIGRDKWDKFTQTYEGYLFWMEKTLSLNSEMVIYTQSRFEDKILDIRKKYDNDLSKTIIIIQELEDLEVYKLFYDDLNKLMSSEEFIKKVSFPDVPEMSKPLYNIIMFNKVFWLEHSVNNKYFDNDMVIWADAGGLREPLENYSNVSWPNINKINSFDNNKITFFSHKSDFNINDNEKEHISLSQIRHIQGTAFLSPSHMVKGLLDEMVKTITESINGGYIGSDEKIFDITYIRDKEKYHLIECTWREYFQILL